MAFLPYGDDAGLVFRHDLKSEVTAGNISGIWTNRLIVGDAAGPDFNTTLGTIAENGTADSGYRLQTYLGPSTNNGWQITIKVGAEWVTRLGSGETPPNGSVGFVPAVNELLLSTLAAVGGSQGLIRKETANVLSSYIAGIATNEDFLTFTTGGVSVGALRVNSWGKDPDYIEINIGCDGDLATGATLYFGIDGNPLASQVTTIAGFDEILENFYIGSDRGIAGSFVNSHYSKDLQISTPGPTFGAARADNLYVLSDSLSNPITQNNTKSYDNNWAYSFQRSLYNNTNTHMPEFGLSENAGFGIGSYVAAGQLITPLTAFLANSPVNLVICGATNDIMSDGLYDAIDFEASYRALIEEALGVNGNPATTVDRLMLTIPPPIFTATTVPARAANQASINALIPQIAQWAINTYGATVVVIDNFANMGADNNLADNSIYPQNTEDGIHYTSDWMRIYGEGIFTALFASVAAPTLTTPYSDLINLNGDVVAGTDLKPNISGATSYEVTFDPIIPSGLSDTNSVISGTVTTPTLTSVCTVVGSNSFGKVADSFQWITLTAGSGVTTINKPINSTIN